MKLYQVSDSSYQHWYVAESADHALRLFLGPYVGDLPEDLTTIRERIEDTVGDPLEEIEVNEFDDDQVLTIFGWSRYSLRTKKTAAEWVAVMLKEAGGPGCLATTCN